jgi:archaeal flagellin FlaB
VRSPVLNENAFTGVEAAIVFIAFIVVASVFTYIMLGTGFFATQASQRVAHSGVQGAVSSIHVVGDIYGLSSDVTRGIDTIEFSVSLSSSGTPVELKNSQMIFSTENSLENLAYTSGVARPGQWNISSTSNGNKNGVLSANQIWTLDMKPAVFIPPGTQFTLEVKAQDVPSFSISRTVPKGLDSMNILY